VSLVDWRSALSNIGGKVRLIDLVISLGLVHRGCQFLADDRHFRGRFDPDPHSAVTQLDHGNGNFVADKYSLANFATENQH
jgi:hypothetical protein